MAERDAPEAHGDAPAGGSVGGAVTGATARPDPDFEVVSVDVVPRSATPTLSFAVEVRDDAGVPIHLIALTVLITIEPGARGYDPADRERLVELFGEPERWGSTASAFRWTQVETLVPAFSGRGTFTFPVECTYDHEIAATKYFGGVGSGAYPLRLHFNGTTHYEGPDGRLQIVPLAWDRSTRFELPVATWRRMIDAHYPRGTWLRLREETLQRLGRYKAGIGAPTADDAIDRLLADAGVPESEGGGG